MINEKKFRQKKDKKTFIIAEIGNNHEGNFNLAKKLIFQAAKAGADAVKFQTFKTEEFVGKANKKRFKQLKKFELSFSEFKKLKLLANKKKLYFISTPLDIMSAKFLIKNSDIIKISSGDNNFFPLLDIIISSKKKIIISLGLTNLQQIKILINYLSKKIGRKTFKKRISLLHCVTSYPVENKYANLKSIPYISNKTGLSIGYSDHTIGISACLGAVSLGANIIEKHFTLNKNFSRFRDHSISADYNELKTIVLNIRKLETQIGKHEKKVSYPEKKIIKSIRRSAYSSRFIKKNEVLNFNNVKFLRSSKSNKFENLMNIIGKKIKKNIYPNKIITKKNLF